MRLSLRSLALSAVVAAACAESPSAPLEPSRIVFAKGAAGGGGGGGGGGVPAGGFVATGEWFGVFDVPVPGQANVDLLLTQTGSAVSGTATFTLTQQGDAVATSAVTGSSDGASLTLRFTCPSTGRSCSVTAPYTTRRGLGIVGLVVDDSTHVAVGDLNIVRR